MRAVLVEPCKPIRILIRRSIGADEMLIFVDLGEAERFSLETDDIGVVVLSLDQSATVTSAAALYRGMQSRFPNAQFIFFTNQKVFAFAKSNAMDAIHEPIFAMRPDINALIEAVRRIICPNGRPSSSVKEIDEEE